VKEMQVEDFVEILGADFYTGVPDSQLKPLCNYLINTYGISDKHVIAANEGNCTAIAAGYHLATGKVPVVYMQNSGIGNIINPVASLLNDKVYAIPCIFIVGWRGEPGVHDEPQHIYQGEVTVRLLEDMGINVFVLSKDTEKKELCDAMIGFSGKLKLGKNVAIVVRKGALSYDTKIKYKNANEMKREEIIRQIVSVTGDDPIVSTTGKASRELFEIREQNGQGHKYDFLTVGSMGHSSSIALGIAMNKPNQKVWCLDGDGAALMHMGSMAVIGSSHQKNMVHVIINNGAHETVGGMPTVASKIDLCKIAKGCGYDNVMCASNVEELYKVLTNAKKLNELCFIEVKAAIGAREDLGRPTTTAIENKNVFMEFLKE
jgi:phosphonopyruvate decarboxylase